MKIDKKLLFKSIALPLAVGGVAAFLTMGSMEQFEALNQPPLSPPGWLFPIVWTILYTLMGIASYLIQTVEGNDEQKKKAISLYRYQLIVNFLWPTFFFNFQWFFFSLLWLLLLWVLVFIMLLQFYKLSKPAAYLIVPYLLWLTFAAYLNFGVWLLN